MQEARQEAMRAKQAVQVMPETMQGAMQEAMQAVQETVSGRRAERLEMWIRANTFTAHSGNKV